MNKRFATAMAVYVVLMLIAILTLHGIVLKATALALILFAVKTVIAHKAHR